MSLLGSILNLSLIGDDSSTLFADTVSDSKNCSPGAQGKIEKTDRVWAPRETAEKLIPGRRLIPSYFPIFLGVPKSNYSAPNWALQGDKIGMREIRFPLRAPMLLYMVKFQAVTSH